MNARRTNLLLVAIVSIVCLVVLEASAAFIFTHSDMTNGKRLVLNAIEGDDRFVGVKDSYIIPHPYMLYTTRPGFESFGFMQIDSLGYRGHEVAREKPPGTYRVLCLGGSTTFSYPYIQDPANTWPGLLEAKLNQRFPSHHFEVLNAGLPYATSAEMLAGYMFRHRYMEPDLVIIHEGGNDADPLMYENYNPEYSHFRQAGIRIPVGRVERTLLRSNVFKIAFACHWRYVPSIYVAQPYEFARMPRDEAMKRAQDTYPLGFERNLDLIVRTAREDGANVLLAGFVVAPEAVFTQKWPWMKGLEPAVMLGIHKNLLVMEQVGEKYHVPYLSPETVSIKDEWFVDGCHLTETGEQAKAEWIFDGVTHLIEGTP